MATRGLTLEQTVVELNELLHLDCETAGAYASALSAIAEAPIRQALEVFQADHERHVVSLHAIVLRCGGEPAAEVGTHGGVKGLWRRGLVRLAGLMGTEQALRALLSIERVTNDTYARKMQAELPPDILDVLRRNYGDEQRHFTWIDSALRTRLWEHADQVVQP